MNCEWHCLTCDETGTDQSAAHEHAWSLGHRAAVNNTRARWTTGPRDLSRRDAIARLTKAGCTAPEIAAQLGVTIRTVYRARQITGGSRDRSTPMTDSELAIARALLEDGASYGEVARTLRRGACTIGRHFPGYGWSVGSGGEYRRAMQLLDSLRPVLPVTGIAS